MELNINNNVDVRATGVTDVQSESKIHRFVSRLKSAVTNILQKLGFCKAPVLTSKHTVPVKLNSVTVRSFENNNSFNSISAESININHIKQAWQEGLIRKRVNEGVDVWAKIVVVDNLKGDSSTFDQMFSRKDGVFNLDKLTSDELTALQKACNTVKDQSLMLKAFNTFIMLKNPNVSIKDQYDALRNLEKEILNHLEDSLPKLSNENVSNKKEIIAKELKELETMLHFSNEIINIEKYKLSDVSTSESMMKNFIAKFFQDFMRAPMPLKEAEKFLAAGALEKVQYPLAEMLSNIQSFSKKTRAMDSIVNFIGKNEKNSNTANNNSNTTDDNKIYLTGDDSMSQKMLDNFIEKHIKPSQQAS